VIVMMGDRTPASWWDRTSRRLATRVGAFGATGALLFGACGPTPTRCAPAPAPTTTTTSAAPAVNVVLQAKPVQAPCEYTDTWGAARGDGRVHLGTDISAPEGNEVYAVVTGVISQIYTDAPGSLAGNGLRIRMADGTWFFYHLHLEVHPGGGEAVNSFSMIQAVGAC
jgi:murein DD-endopeptidase MepM/ murein hydrolase activator NlpD